MRRCGDMALDETNPSGTDSNIAQRWPEGRRIRSMDAGVRIPTVGALGDAGAVTGDVRSI